MTEKRIAQMRKWYPAPDNPNMNECLDEIELLQGQLKDANKAIKLAAKGRK